MIIVRTKKAVQARHLQVVRMVTFRIAPNRAPFSRTMTWNLTSEKAFRLAG